VDAALKWLAEVEPNSKGGLIARLVVALNAGELDEAGRVLEQVKKLASEEEIKSLALYEAELAARKGDIDGAVRVIEQIRGQEELVGSLTMIAGGLESRNAVEAAIRIRSRLGGMEHDQRAAAWEKAGDLWRDKLGNNEEARKAYEKSLEVDPGRRSALVELFRTALRAKDWKGAESACDRLEAVAENDEQREQAKLRRAHLLCVRGQVEEALNVIQQTMAAGEVLGAAQGVAQHAAADGAPKHAQALVKAALKGLGQL
jgi:tetratricopeptide (TPR) repeat protein